MKHYSVIIVGGGPAGSSVAHHLMFNQKITSALLIEGRNDSSFSKYHQMCAEGISRKGLMETGLEISGLVKNEVTRAIEYWPGNITIDSEIDGLIIDREKLISKLRESFTVKGGEIGSGRVSKIGHSGSGFTVEISEDEYSCDYLVGADGAHSVIRRDVFHSEPIAYMKVIQYLIDKPMDNSLRFKFDERYRGKYRWEFPSGNLSKVGFPFGTDDPPEDVVDVHGRSIPVGHLDRIVNGQACLVGDAACQANPVTFSGIRNSLKAGYVAAEAIAAGDLHEYQQMWDQSYQADLSFLNSYLLIRDQTNDELRELMEPFRHGMSMTRVMGELMKSEDFRVFYRAFVRKMQYGW